MYFPPTHNLKMRVWQYAVISTVIILMLTSIYNHYISSNQYTDSIPVLMIVTDWNHHRKILFENCLESLLANTKHFVKLHLIVDNGSAQLASEVARRIGRNQMNVSTYLAEDIYQVYIEEIHSLRKFFSDKSKPYYQRSTFYLAPIVQYIIKEDKLLIFDIDIMFIRDLYYLYEEFEYFKPQEYWGLAYEQSPYYMLVLRDYTLKNPKSICGQPSHQGGNPGFNSGILLVDIKKLNQHIDQLKTYLTESYYSFLVNNYLVQGKLVLGDQDFLSFLSFEHPEMFHILDCGWNRQLCEWFKKDFSDLFEVYHRCDQNVKILHGNCNTTIHVSYAN